MKRIDRWYLCGMALIVASSALTAWGLFHIAAEIIRLMAKEIV